MKIDNVIEPLVREAFAAGVAREPGRLSAALRSMLDRGEQAAQWGIRLALAVDTYVLFDLHEGRPDEEQVRSLAASFAESETWCQIDQTSADVFLNALAEERQPSAALSSEVAVLTAFTLGAWLLSAFLPEGRSWTDYLDDALLALETTPEIAE